MEALSQKQKRVLTFLKRFHRDHGYMPSMREVQQELGFKSIRSVQDYFFEPAKIPFGYSSSISFAIFFPSSTKYSGSNGSRFFFAVFRKALT